MKFQRQQVDEINVNLTPLIDVVFLLLIFFMVSTTFTRETQLEVDLPQAENSTEVDQQRSLEVVITAEGEYRVNGEGLVNSQARTLRLALTKVSSENYDQPLTISADARTPHQAVVTAMDVAGALGFKRLSITTRESE
ncbi:MAG: biopolymer transporter ExbD [Oceanospirillaceae bacterium]|nr:biopolymer transporter ExbD [Oceanospirillaceae bacterium]